MANLRYRISSSTGSLVEQRPGNTIRLINHDSPNITPRLSVNRRPISSSNSLEHSTTLSPKSYSIASTPSSTSRPNISVATSPARHSSLRVNHSIKIRNINDDPPESIESIQEENIFSNRSSKQRRQSLPDYRLALSKVEPGLDAVLDASTEVIKQSKTSRSVDQIPRSSASLPPIVKPPKPIEPIPPILHASDDTENIMIVVSNEGGVTRTDTINTKRRLKLNDEHPSDPLINEEQTNENSQEKQVAVHSHHHLPAAVTRELWNS